MSRTAWRVAVLALLLPTLARGWTADQVDFPGDVQGWDLGLNSTKYTGPDGSTEWFRYSFKATKGTNTYYFKTVTGNDWNNSYGSNFAFPKDQASIMHYGNSSMSASLLSGGATQDFWYVFTAKDPGLVDTHISVMEVSSNPATLTAVSGGTASFATNEGVSITITLSTNPCAQEKLFVRYTTNGWASFSIVPASVSSNRATVTFTNLGLAFRPQWYAFSSTASSNYLASTNGFSVDALTLSWLNNGGANYGFGTPGDAAWVWHNSNRVAYDATNVQFWAKIGYCNGDGSDRWITNAAIYYTTDGTAPSGSYGVPSGSTLVRTMQFDHVESDSSSYGEGMWWAGTVTNLPTYTVIKYKIGAWYSTSLPERFADYGTSGTNNNTFTFQIGYVGEPELTVNGVNANYTTTKFFVDEIAHETQSVVVVFKPGAANLEKVEVFTDLDRRDFCDVDYTNAYLAADGCPDGIKGPDGNYLTTNDVGAYYRAYPMSLYAAGEYRWTGTASRCGAYRLTARYTTNGMAANTWHWYTDWAASRRDHAIVVTPKKALGLTMYELNTLTVKATDNTEAGRGTFARLLEGSDSFTNFNLSYLNRIQANCLWFQPIHPNAVTLRGNTGGYVPGSPYATRNYFAVSRYMSAAETEEGSLGEFTNFVIACDANTTSVGSIHVMLDGVFNHTSWDPLLGQGGVDLGFAAGASASMASNRPCWFSLMTDYGSNATHYTDVYTNDFATAPDRGDFGKWPDVTDLYFGRYAALVRHNPDNNGDYLSEGDWLEAASLATNVVDLWRFFAYYPEFWLRKTGHPGSNTWVLAQDDMGIDGLRCDFGQGLPPQCWEYIINRTRRIKWNFLFMAETLDGGVPGYRSNRHFDILNENLVFKFTQEHINDSWDLRNALESRRSSYSGGLVLLNLTSHDEVLPDSDCWLVASRYGAVGAMDGIPMIFYGQEQGIQNWAGAATTNTGFKTPHEENFGKYIPNFKQWNKLTVWESPPANSGGLAQWYGRVNGARLNSPALQSPNRYFLSKVGGGDEARILAVAKYQAAYAPPRTSDVVLAFALLLRHGESPHVGASATYDLQPVWSLLGLDTGKTYQVRNLASSQPLTPLTSGWPRTGQDLYDNGLWVNLPADNGGTTAITNDGALVQYLKIEEVNHAPVITLPGPHLLPVGAATNFAVTASDEDGDSVSLTNAAAPAGATFSAGTFSWTASPAFENTTNLLRFVADDLRGETNSVATNATTITVPFDWDGDGLGDGWEWTWFTTLTQSGTADYDGDGANNYGEYVAGTEPTGSNSVLEVTNIVTGIGQTSHWITVVTEPGRRYTLYYADEGLSNNAPWMLFANTNDGFGTWLETNTVPASHTFVDDEGTNTTSGGPFTGRRFYRVMVQKP